MELLNLLLFQQCLVGIEACGGSKYWNRVFEHHEHVVRMMAPQFVKPYVKSNKNNVVDAEAICERINGVSVFD